MSKDSCVAIREEIPDVAAGRHDGVDLGMFERHVETCDDCRAELALARALFASRVEVPERLSDRIVDAVRRDRSTVRRVRPWWGISAAAVAALALGIGIASEPGVKGDGFDLPEYAAEVEITEDEFWISDDGMLAGAPAVDALTDEALVELLDELAMGSAGGAA